VKHPPLDKCLETFEELGIVGVDHYQYC